MDQTWKERYAYYGISGPPSKRNPGPTMLNQIKKSDERGYRLYLAYGFDVFTYKIGAPIANLEKILKSFYASCDLLRDKIIFL